MANLTVDFSTVCGAVKPMHCVNNGPIPGRGDQTRSNLAEYKAAGIPFARNHDAAFYSGYGGEHTVDVAFIFPDFSRDPEDETAYDFAMTDKYVADTFLAGTETFYRLGAKIEHGVKKYNIHPPADFNKWARICEHIIRHYNEGWADGFNYGIEYWEIWNEPDGHPRLEMNQMWRGTPEQFYELYDVTAKHLKACFGDTIKVGGYGSCELCGIFYDPEKFGIKFRKSEPDALKEKYDYRIVFFNGFLKYIKEHGSPMDFFSWHSYRGVSKTVAMDEYVHKTLSEYGYDDVEIHINEWNNAPAFVPENHGSSFAASSAAAMMLALQNGHADMLMYYDTRVEATAYGGFFAPFTNEPTATYYSFVAFSKLYELGTQTEAVIDCDAYGFYAVSATNGKKNALMIVNRTGETQELNIEGVDLSDARYYILDKNHLLSMAFDARSIAKDTVLLIEW